PVSPPPRRHARGALGVPAARPAGRREPGARRSRPHLPSQFVRRAAMAYLAWAGSPAADCLTPGTRQTIEALTPDVCREAAVAWREAARAMDGAVSRDFLFAIARFRQARMARWHEETDEALRGLLAPRSGMLE